MAVVVVVESQKEAGAWHAFVRALQHPHLCFQPQAPQQARHSCIFILNIRKISSLRQNCRRLRVVVVVVKCRLFVDVLPSLLRG